jgi:hypothetical protein
MESGIISMKIGCSILETRNPQLVTRNPQSDTHSKSITPISHASWYFSTGRALLADRLSTVDGMILDMIDKGI